MKSLFRITLLFCTLLNLTKLAYSQREGGMVGNGGSGSEAQLFAEQASYSHIIKKIGLFFMKHPELQQEFPDVNLEYLVKHFTANANLKVVNEELVDKDGVTRTCLNFSGTYNIECNYSQLQKIKNVPNAQFVIMFHELLGLMGVEETTPKNPEVIDGYRISKELAPYVMKVGSYDLRIEKKELNKVYLTSKFSDFDMIMGRFSRVKRKWWLTALVAIGAVPTFGILPAKAYARGQDRVDDLVQIRIYEKSPNSWKWDPIKPLIEYKKPGFMHHRWAYSHKGDDELQIKSEFVRIRQECRTKLKKMFPDGEIVEMTRGLYKPNSLEIDDDFATYDDHEGYAYFCMKPKRNNVTIPKKGQQYSIEIKRARAELVEG